MGAFPITMRFPLKRRDGSIRAWANIDAADWPEVSRHRWHLANSGYVRRNAYPTPGGNPVSVQLHRQLAGLVPGDGLEVDHRDGDPLNNRRSNLLVCEHAHNAQNRQRGNRGASSEYRGVSLRKDRTEHPWAAYGRANGRHHHIGFFDTEEEAAAASSAWRSEHMPFSTN